MSNQTLIRDLAALHLVDRPQVGGKAAALGELIAQGFCVPPGFVITAQAFEVYDGAATLPEEFMQDVLQTFDALGADLVAVRSSAIAEDGKTAAWAGQLESYLNTPREQLIPAIQQCWASIHLRRAVSYAKQQGVAQSSVAVIVQQMIAAEVAGVSFSVHPVTQNRDELIIEVVAGLGESLVSGRATPDGYTVHKPTGEIRERNLSEPPRQLLNDAQIQELSKIIVDIEQKFGYPIDVEWAFADGNFWIVQARAITTL